ncbi:MAG: ATP-binding protein [bacterium]
MALSHKIIQEHEGTITVQSEEGEGTTFTIILPV